MTSNSMLSSSSDEDEIAMEEEDEDTVRCTHMLEAIEEEEEESNPLQAALDAITQLAKEAEMHSRENYEEKAKKASLEESEHVLGSRKASSVDNTFGAGEQEAHWDEEMREARMRAKLLHSSFDEDKFGENQHRKYSNEVDNDERRHSKEEDDRRYSMEDKGEIRYSRGGYENDRKSSKEEGESERRYCKEEDNANRKYSVEGDDKKYLQKEGQGERKYSKGEDKNERKHSKIGDEGERNSYDREYNNGRKYRKERFEDKEFDFLKEYQQEKSDDDSQEEVKKNKYQTIEQRNKKNNVKVDQNSSFPRSSSLVRSRVSRPSWDPASLIDETQQVDQPEAEVRPQPRVEARVQDEVEVEPPTPPPRKSRLWPFKFGKRSQENLNKHNLDKTSPGDDLEKENFAQNLKDSNKDDKPKNNEGSETRENEYIKDSEYFESRDRRANNGYMDDIYDNKSYNWKRSGDFVKSDETDKSEDRKQDNVEMRDEYIIEARDPYKRNDTNEKENYKNSIKTDYNNKRDDEEQNEEEKIYRDRRSNSSNVDNTQILNNEEVGRKMRNNDFEERPLETTKNAYNEEQESREGSYERILEASPDALQSDLLWPCPICNRTFTRAALERHIAICRRVSTKKRPLFGQSRSTPTTPSSSPSVQRRKKSTTIEDELQVCPCCGRKFNFKAYDKHVQWCAEKHRRLMQSPNKDAQALAKLHARTHYRPSSANRDEFGLRKQSSTHSLLSAVSPTPSRSSVMTTNDISSRMNNNHTRESEQTQFIRAATGRGSIKKGPAPTKASQLRQLAKEQKESGEEPIYAPRRTPSRSSSFRRLNNSPGLMSQSYHAGDGQLQRQLSNLSQTSVESSARPRIMRSEPEGTDHEIADKVVEAYDHSVEYDPYKSAEQQMQALLFGTKLPKVRPMRVSSNSAFERYVPSTSDINNKLGSKFDNKPKIATEIERPASTRVARFCHECGSPFALPTIRFCCECGVRRLYC